MLQIGSRWNESELIQDPLTGRTIRRLTTRGWVNQSPTYHTNSAFTSDARYLAFVSVREGATWIVRAEAESGELAAIWRAPGNGDRSYLHRDTELAGLDIDGGGLQGTHLCLAPRRGLAVAACNRSLLAIDLQTCAVRRLLDDIGPEWIFGAPCVSPGESHVAIALSSAHPQIAAGQPVTRSYLSFQHTLRLLTVPLEGGEPKLLLERRPAQSAHCAFCPADDGLLYYDLDLPPQYWCGSDGETPRVWLLETGSRRTWPLKTTYPGPFQIHIAWLWDGSGIAYHGWLPGGGDYIGITGRDGSTRWERAFPEAKLYGHLSPDAGRPALILDGHFAPDLLQWLYTDQPDSQPPRVEPICVHGTEWESLPGQYSHPHPLADPTGRRILYTAAHGGRSDVYLVQV